MVLGMSASRSRSRAVKSARLVSLSASLEKANPACITHPVTFQTLVDRGWRDAALTFAKLTKGVPRRSELLGSVARHSDGCGSSGRKAGVAWRQHCGPGFQKLRRRKLPIHFYNADAVPRAQNWRSRTGAPVAMDRMERFLLGTAIAGFLVMIAALIWMAVA
jgi:hypothetical protein